MKKTMLKEPTWKDSYAGYCFSFYRSCVQGQGEACRSKPGEAGSWEPVPKARILQPLQAAQHHLSCPFLPCLICALSPDLQTPLWKACKSSFHSLLFRGSVKFWFNQGWILNWPKQPVSVGNSTTLQGPGMGGERKERARKGVANAELKCCPCVCGK